MRANPPAMRPTSKREPRSDQGKPAALRVSCAYGSDHGIRNRLFPPRWNRLLPAGTGNRLPWPATACRRQSGSTYRNRRNRYSYNGTGIKTEERFSKVTRRGMNFA